jgi:hypothetical protein
VSKPSKFQGVFQHRRQPEVEAEAVTPELIETELAQPSPPDVSTTPTKKMGRPAGKRSDPKFTQVTAYIQSQTYRDVKVALLLAAEQQEFSQLMEALLIEWLSTQKSK